MFLLYLYNHLKDISSGYSNCAHVHEVIWWLTRSFCSRSDFLKESSVLITGLGRGIVCHRICRGPFLCPPHPGTFGKWDVALTGRRNQHHPTCAFPCHGHLYHHGSTVPSKQGCLHPLAPAPKGSCATGSYNGTLANCVFQVIPYFRHQAEFCLNPDITISITSQCTLSLKYAWNCRKIKGTYF